MQTGGVLATSGTEPKSLYLGVTEGEPVPVPESSSKAESNEYLADTPTAPNQDSNYGPLDQIVDEEAQRFTSELRSGQESSALRPSIGTTPISVIDESKGIETKPSNTEVSERMDLRLDLAPAIPQLKMPPRQR